MWDVVAEYLRARPSLAAPKLNLPRLRGVDEYIVKPLDRSELLRAVRKFLAG